MKRILFFSLSGARPASKFLSSLSRPSAELHRLCAFGRGECKLCGIRGSYEEVAMASTRHKRFCERYSERCHFCGVFGAAPGGHHEAES